MAAARATVARRAREMGLEQLVDDACLLVTELVTNAILHGRGLCGLTVRSLGPGLRIEVRDASRVPPVLGWASEHALTGRGLRLVSSVTSRWGVDPDGAGKVVWDELSGDIILLCTDGVIEGRSHGSLFDTAGIRRVLAESHRSAHDVVTALGASVLAQSGGRLNDDVAAVAIRLVDPTEETVAQ